MRSALVDILVDILAYGLTWAAGFAVVTFLLGVVQEGSIEAAFRSWTFVRVFDTWVGAAIGIATIACVGLVMGRIGRWAERRERNRRV